MAKTVTAWQLFTAFKDGKKLETPNGYFSRIDAIQKEDGSGKCWNVTGTLFSDVSRVQTVFVHTLD